MIELSQCPNCAETDRITIAGKVFCVRCGTETGDPTSSSDPPQKTDQPRVSKFTINPANSDQGRSVQQTTPMPDVNNPKPVAPLSVNNNIIQAPTQTPTQSQSTAIQIPDNQRTMNDVQKLDNQINQLNRVQPSPRVPQPQTESRFNLERSQQIDSPVVNTTQTQLDQSQQTKSTISPPLVTQTESHGALLSDFQSNTQAVYKSSPSATTDSNPTTVSDITHRANQPLTRREQTVGDIMSLDKKEPNTFSDEQLRELEKINSQDENTTLGTNSSNSSTLDIMPIARTMASNSSQKTSSTNKPSMSKVKENYIGPPKKTSKKILKTASVAASIAIIFLAGVYIWHMNYPHLAFKVASAKAGVNANLPGYIPSGYKLAGEIQTNPGRVSYILEKDGKQVNITQTKTDWDSQALAENYIAAKAENYLALQSQGLTIYIFGNNQAAWVNKGNWYIIESPEETLTQDQVIKIATSL